MDKLSWLITRCLCSFFNVYVVLKNFLTKYFLTFLAMCLFGLFLKYRNSKNTSRLSNNHSVHPPVLPPFLWHFLITMTSRDGGRRVLRQAQPEGDTGHESSDTENLVTGQSVWHCCLPSYLGYSSIPPPPPEASPVSIVPV